MQSGWLVNHENLVKVLYIHYVIRKRNKNKYNFFLSKEQLNPPIIELGIEKNSTCKYMSG